MDRFIAAAVSFALLVAPTPAFAAADAVAATAETEMSGFKLAAQDAPVPPKAADTEETAKPDYRLDHKKSGTGKKILKGTAITLGVVGAIVAGFFVFYRAKCGPNARNCSE